MRLSGFGLLIMESARHMHDHWDVYQKAEFGCPPRDAWGEAWGRMQGLAFWLLGGGSWLFLVFACLGPPVVPSYRFFGEGSPTKVGHRKRVPLF